MAAISYEQQQANAKAQEEAAKQAALNAQLAKIPVAGAGAMSFGEIDTFLKSNPDAQYFRITNGGGAVSKPRSYQTEWGAWNDNSAAIVSGIGDKDNRDIFRYTQIAAHAGRQGKRGERATTGFRVGPTSFFTENGYDYKTDYGMVLSRDEFAQYKQRVKQQGATFLNQPMQYPDARPILTEADGAASANANSRRQRKFILGSPDATEELGSGAVLG